jgi:hypothetical protein
MELHEVMLVIHIAAAGTWLGTNILQAVVPGLAGGQGAEVAAGWYRVTAEFGKRVYMPASILILVTGVVLVLQDDSLSFGSLFVTIGFVMIVLGVLLGIFVFTPGSEKAAEAIESGDPSRIKAATSRIAVFGTIDTLLLLFTMTVMVLRWT